MKILIVDDNIEFQYLLRRWLADSVYEFDIVPHIPPAGFLLRYWHHWSEVMLKDNGGVVEGRSLARKLACDGLMMWHACRVLMNLDLWKDVKEYHSIEMYIGKLESLRR